MNQAFQYPLSNSDSYAFQYYKEINILLFMKIKVNLGQVQTPNFS